jgi:hypothetical protein
MSGQSNAIVLDPDPRAGRQLALGFSREGVPVRVLPVDGPLDLADPGVVVVGGALDLVRRTRSALTERNLDIPIVFTGGGARAEAEAAGADEVVTRPAFLRDLVTIAKLVRGVPANQRDHLVGSLAETTGVYTLVRALAALGRSAVLTLIRGLRRGEIRFYKGEVTSAQVGLIHGQAAFHQLLLWTDARFDYQHEDIVRRHQIPLSPEELFADAERFLEGVREHAGSLSPATVLEQDVQRVHGLGKQIPTEVHGVLRMFDGHRVLADILEDSPYRVFETLRVAQKAVDVGLLRHVEGHKKKATWRAVLAIEEWLVGSETRDAVVERTSSLDITAPVPRESKKQRKRRAKAPSAPSPAPKEIDWGALVPRVIGAEVGPLSGVVPAAAAHGEIELPTRDKPREGLEALMDTDKRDRIFPTEIGVEPSIVVRDDGEPDEWEKAEWDAKARALAEEKARAEAAAALAEVEKQHAAAEHARAEAARKEAALRAIAETPPAGMPMVTPESVPAPSPLDAEALRASAPERVGESVERMRLERLRREQAEQKAREELDRKVAEAERAQAERTAREAADAERTAREAADAERTAREAADAAAARLIAIPKQPSPSAGDPAAAVTGAPDAAAPARDRAKPGTDARDLVRQLVAEVVPPAANATAERTRADGAGGEHTRADGAGDDGEHVHTAAPVTIAETPVATVQVADTFTVVTSADTARVTASPTVTIREAAPPADPLIAQPVAPVADEPSDGIVRSPVATVDTARMRARDRRPTPAPEHDGPPQKEATGEIGHRAARAPQAAVEQPSIVVEQLVDRQPVAEDRTAFVEKQSIDQTPVRGEQQTPVRDDQPSLLVADLAAVHAAAASAARQPPPATSANAATPARELAVSDVHRDAALALTDAEEAFFNKAETGPVRAVKPESFDDLDEGYEPPKFWDRVFGRKKPPKR